MEQILAALKGNTGGSVTAIDAASVEQAQSEAFKVMSFIHAFMTHGHLCADLDPLKLDTEIGAKQY